MWTCIKCGTANEYRFDLCEACGTSTTGKRDVFLHAIASCRTGLIRFAIALPFLYVSSYFILGTHVSGFTDASAKKWYHDRRFAFDPWIYQPLAYFEQRMRGTGTQVVLDGSPGRDGGSIYGFGP